MAGLLTKVGNQLLFNYGKSYLERKNAISIYEPELPLQAGDIPLHEGLSMPSCIRDASPDAWGRRVLINRRLGLKGLNASEVELDELTLSSGFRVGPDWRSGLPAIGNKIRPAGVRSGIVRGTDAIRRAG